MNWNPLNIAGAVVVIGGALALIVGFIRWLARTGKNVSDIKDDLLGEPARKGVPARPGVLERMATQDQDLAVIKKDQAEIKRELTVNGGAPLKDAVTQMSGRLENVETTLATLVASQPVIVNTGPVSMHPQPPSP